MKKSILSMLGALCMALMLLPITAKADGPVAGIKIIGQEMNDTSRYYYNNYGVDTSASEEEANAIFDATTGTLTLNNLDITADASGIWWNYQDDGKHDLTIVLQEGTTNTIVRNTAGSAINGESGFDEGPSLTIKGPGTLNITGGTNAIWVWEDVTIQDGAKVNLIGNSKMGICTNSPSSSEITIKGNSEVNVIGATYGIGWDNSEYREHVVSLYDGTITVKGENGAFSKAPTLDSGANWTVEVGESSENNNAWDGSTPLTSYKYVKMVGVGKSAIYGTATITGTAKSQETLVAALEGLDNAGTLTYVWKSGDTVLQEGNSNSLVLDSTHVGKTITVTITSSNYSGSVTSQAIGPVEAGDTTTPSDTIAPAVHGIQTSRTSVSTATVRFATTEAGTYYYKCQHEGASPAPSASELKQYGTSASCVSGENIISLANLTAGIYEIYIASEDAAGNMSNVHRLPIYEDIASGNVKDVTDKASNLCNSFLDVYGSDLVAKVLSTEDQQAVAGGKDVKVWLEVKAGENKATDAEKTLTQSKLGDYTLGMYLDLTLWKQFEGENAVALEKTNEAVTVTFAVPQSLINTDTSKTRAYEIIRIHDDGTGAKADVLPCVYNPETHIASFKTDKFSIYSLAYKDTAIVTENNNNSNANDDNANDGTDDNNTTISADDQLDEVPKTGENGNIYIWLSLALLCGIGALFCRTKVDKCSK